MTDAATISKDKPARFSRGTLALGLFLASAGAAGGYYGVSAGLFRFTGHGVRDGAAADPERSANHVADVEFVELDPILISLNSAGLAHHLRFRAQLEIDAGAKTEVEHLLPRVMDVLNGYLRALQLDDLRDPLALTKLRAQMLRRVQIVVGNGGVRDVLIMEFVLN